MGKAARQKRFVERAAEVEKPLRSAYVACLREQVWASKQPDNSDYGRQINHASRVMLTHPEMRVVKFPARQADAFRDYGEDMLLAADEARPPFKHTFYDLGYVPLVNFEFVGASVFGEGRQWTALAYLRQRGTNDWTTQMMASGLARNARKAHGDGLRMEILNPRHNRPYSQDDAQAATLIIAGVLTFLESANVELIDAIPLPRSHKAAGVPHYEVVVRQGKKRLVYPDGHQPTSADWSHRWEVCGHFKHFRRGVVFDSNAERRIHTTDGDEFVRIWCPPHVKGPEDKPLIPKTRKVVA